MIIQIDAALTEEEVAQYPEVAAVLAELVEEVCREHELFDILRFHLGNKITRKFPELNGFRLIDSKDGMIQVARGNHD